MITCQSERGVGAVKGYPYYAWGLYAVAPRAKGGYYWKLIGSSRPYRSDKRCKHKFDGVEVREGVRHGKPCTADGGPIA